MSSNNRKRDKDKIANNSEKNKENGINNQKENDIKDDIKNDQKIINDDECEEILKELDEIEKNKTKITSKAKDLIKSDKEAISKMKNKQDSNLEKNDTTRSEKIEADDLDYLDDENSMSSEEIFNDNKKENIKEKSKQIVKEKENNQSGKKEYSKKKTKKIPKNSQKVDNKENQREDADIKDNNFSADDKDNLKEPEVELDFLASLEKDHTGITQIRKKEPKRLNSTQGHNIIDVIKRFANENKKNFIVGTSIAVLLVIMFIALIVDSNNGKNDKVDADFVKMDTKPMIEVVNNYYASLIEGDIQKVRTYLVDNKDLTDDAISQKCAESKTYAELISDSFTITDCYIQKGLKKNEYIAYLKFQIKIKSIDTPAVGIFTCYMVDVSKDKNKTEYKISTEINDKSSEQYKYIIKMKSCKVVTDLFKKVDKELAQACEKDANLKSIVDALKDNGDTNKKNGDTQNAETTSATQETTVPTTAAAN